MPIDNKLLTDVIEHLPVSIFAKDARDDFRFVLWNKKMEEMSGLSKDQVLGNTDYDLFGDSSEARHFGSTDKAVMSQGDVVEIEREEVVTPSGAIICHTLKVPLELDDGTKLLLAIIEDVTSAVRNEEQLHTYRNELEALVKKRTHQLQELANKDSLTGLYNRNYLLTATDKIISKREESAGFAVVFIDLDGFKLLNDSYGHRLGDELLRQVGTRLTQFASRARVVSRLGGDEFVLIVDDCDESALSVLANEIYQRIAQPFFLHKRSYTMTCSIGISLWPRDASESTLLLQAADIAMYTAKSGSYAEHCVFYHRDMLAASKRKLELEQALRHALDNNEFYLDVQPQFAVGDTLRPIGVEMLLRWRSTKFGSVSPAEFIPVAEKAGLMRGIGQWVLEQSCLFAADLCAEVPQFSGVSVNLSATEIDTNLAKRVLDCLAHCGLLPQALTLEITETELANFTDEISGQFVILRSAGVRVAIDDFGTGYSSLSYLSQISFDEIKIDRSFVHRMIHDQKTHSLTRAIVSMANILECDVVAEGVESDQQMEYLREMGVTSMQGYLFARPMCTENVCELLRDSFNKLAALSANNR